MYVASNGIKTLVTLPETDPPNPRDHDYQDNLTNMICWHSRYSLGDKHHFKNVQDFVCALAAGVPDKDLFAYIQNGKAPNLRALKTDGREGEDVYTIQGIWDPQQAHGEWSDLGWYYKDGSFSSANPYTYGDRSDILEYIGTVELLNLAEDSNTVALKPLYLYDHSGLAMSTGSFVGRAHHAEWDSGYVGFIYMEKDQALRNLAIAADTLNICKVLSEGERSPIFLSKREGEAAADTFSRNGFSPVKFEDINNLFDPALSTENKPLVNEDLLRNHQVYKKQNILYQYSGDEFNASYQLKPIAFFNPDLERVTEETWKARAEEVLEADVREYDSYLRGDMYGYIQYEGLDERDSCWGFNPCGEDIRGMLDDMVGEWGNDLKDMMLHAPYIPQDQFDIVDYFESHDYPGLRGRIREAVTDHLLQQSEDVSPYAVSIKDLLSDRDSLLTSITEALYDQHVLPDNKTIQQTIQDYAGISRARQPKLTRDDLEPERDYTKDELLAILKTKPALDHLIADARSRQEGSSLSIGLSPPNKEH